MNTELQHEVAALEQSVMRICEEVNRLRGIQSDLLEALTMIRDADEDCRRDGLPMLPDLARATIDAAITRAEGR